MGYLENKKASLDQSRAQDYLANEAVKTLTQDNTTMASRLGEMIDKQNQMKSNAINTLIHGNNEQVASIINNKDYTSLFTDRDLDTIDKARVYANNDKINEYYNSIINKGK